MSTINQGNNVLKAKVVYFGKFLNDTLQAELSERIDELYFEEDVERYMQNLTLLALPDVIIVEVDNNKLWKEQVQQIKSHPIYRGIIIILVGIKNSRQLRRQALELQVNDYYIYPFPLSDLYERINFLIKFKLIRPKLQARTAAAAMEYKMPVAKRAFDIIASGTALILLSPLLSLIWLSIKISSKGNAIYKSKRVGAGYKIFDFYKFRSMRMDADKLLAQMQSLNQYANEGNKNGKSAFVKISKDPRITPLGSFLRMTSLDELPQLFNVLKGDMSLVGNRPLPLYEAEQLTTNKWSTRFNGPAGLTGLWQISKRGKKEMSESERKELDNYYASNYSIFLDFKIILKTLPALIQKEKV